MDEPSPYRPLNDGVSTDAPVPRGSSPLWVKFLIAFSLLAIATAAVVVVFAVGIYQDTQRYQARTERELAILQDHAKREPALFEKISYDKSSTGWVSLHGTVNSVEQRERLREILLSEFGEDWEGHVDSRLGIEVTGKYKTRNTR